MIANIWAEFFDLWEQRNNLVHGNDQPSQDIAQHQKVIRIIKHLHTQQADVLAAHRTSMFMKDTDAKLDSYITSRRTTDLRWVNTWQPGIVASAKYTRLLAAKTMKSIDAYFGYLTSTDKRPARSRVPPRFHTRHDGNRNSRRRLWTVPKYVQPISDF